MKRFVDKVAVVTASTAGIGLAIAKRLGLEGASVVISSRKQDHVNNAIEELKNAGVKNVTGTVCHVGKSDQRQNLLNFAVKEYGKIDVLISNAGTNPHFGDIIDIPEEQWDKIFDTNVKSSFLICRDAVPYMEKVGKGSIVLVSSITGYMPEKTIGAYSVSKTALLGLTKVLAETLAPRGIRVNCVAPGFIKTQFSRALWDTPSIADEIISRTPLNRMGESEDISGAVAYLASDDASFVTGETLIVAGGVPSRL